MTDPDDGLAGKASWTRLALGGGVPRRSFYVALLVGTVLNLINQGDMLFAGAALHWPKIALTYAVPYCVATYGAVAAGRHAARARDREG